MARKPANPPETGWILLLLVLVVAIGITAAVVIVDKNNHSGEPYTPHTSTGAPELSRTTPVFTTTSTSAVTSATTSATTTTTLAPGTVTGISLSFYKAVMNLGDQPVMPIVTMSPADAVNKSEKWTSSDEKVAVVDWIGRITPVGAGSCVIRVTSVNNPNVWAECQVTVEPAAVQTTTLPPTTPAPTTSTTAAGEINAEPVRDDIQVINGITYIQGVMMVNKTYPLPASYNPGGLTPETKAAFAEMQNAASAEAGLSLYSVSDFRSYEKQATLYENYCKRDGKEKADTFSARPGHSEHQTGLTIDVNYAGDAFHDTKEAKWLAENCARFGFIIRFPKGKEAITGYKYESWHIRYVGKEWAKKITDSGLCMEEYFNVESKYVN